MEIILVLIALGIIGYVIFQSSPNQKIRKAESLITSGKYIEAIRILEIIFNKHPLAPARFAECKLELGLRAKKMGKNESLTLFSEVIDIRKRIQSNAQILEYDKINALAQYEISLIMFDSAMEVLDKNNKVEYLQGNIQFIDQATKTGIEGDFSNIYKKHCYQISELLFELGIDAEKQKYYSDAISNYSKAKDYALKSSHLKIPYNSATRIGICKLKTKPKNIEFVSLYEFKKADQGYAHDFFYRYVVHLLKQELYTDAESVIDNYLNLPSNTIKELRGYIRTKQINIALNNLEEINSTVEELYEQSFPIETVRLLYEDLDNKISQIKPFLPNSIEKLQAIKPSLFNRLLSYYINDKQYSYAIKLIHDYTRFWENPELLKDLAICCYGLVTEGGLTEINYQSVISCWLTSVYCDKVIINSLESTTWDDNYTFTLSDAVGSNHKQYTNLPSNVNYDEVTESNISIGETQRELIEQFESVISAAIPDNKLSTLAHEFYSKEKEAIERIIAIIVDDVLFASPYFAKTYNLHDIIINKLDGDYVVNKNEDSLAAGIPYIKGNTDSYVLEYKNSEDAVSRIVNALEEKDLLKLKSTTTQRKRIIINKYFTICELLENSIYKTMHLVIEENIDNKNLMSLIEECIRFSPRNQKLITQYANYIYDYCHSNWDKEPSIKLLELMIKCIRYNPCNYRAAKSLTILINNNLMDIANNNTSYASSIYSLIDQVRYIQSDALIEALKELQILRNKVLITIGREAAIQLAQGNNLNISGIKLKKVLDTMYILGQDSFFKKTPNNNLMDKLSEPYDLKPNINKVPNIMPRYYD